MKHVRAKWRAALAATTVCGALVAGVWLAVASDHDDGENDLKARSLNITDLFVFREDWQMNGGDPNYLIAVMNVTPRALARQQYPFSTRALYQFHFTRVSNKSARPNGEDDVLLSFEFAPPDSSGNQNSYMIASRDGYRWGRLSGKTTTLADADAGTIRTKTFTLSGHEFKVFMGLREDPFYFDVERYFRIRGLLATGQNTLVGGTQTAVNVFKSSPTSVDFAAGYNVNSIVVRIPIAFLKASSETVFDAWATVMLKR